jgi:hypothetical protein
MLRRPTIVQADQTVVPQSYGQQQLQRPLVSQQQLLLDQQQLLQQKIQESLIVTEAGKILYLVLSINQIIYSLFGR